MTATPAVSVSNVAKRYRIGLARSREDTLGGTVFKLFTNPLKRVRELRSLAHFDDDEAEDRQDVVWALRDVSFEVSEGEVLGVIGANGAGKTTLLRVLSRITEPTRGRAVIRGRVSSLLEVGTGFHPELTGRENIYLNGTILGMKRAEIDAKFDEIVAFSGVEQFLDTPVKRYSSGMKVRLAFSVAAHLEPEILLIDEVLSVGDAVFQKKSIEKMGSVARGGRTVLFVSHQMAAVQNLCSRAILLRDGQVAMNGPVEPVISEYLAVDASAFEGGLAYGVRRDMLEESATEDFAVTDISLATASGEPLHALRTGDPMNVRISYRCERDVSDLAFIVRIRGELGERVIFLRNDPLSGYPIRNPGRTGLTQVLIKDLPITAGRCTMDVEVLTNRKDHLVKLEDIVAFDIEESDVYGSARPLHQKTGLIVVPHEWAHYPDWPHGT